MGVVRHVLHSALHWPSVKCVKATVHNSITMPVIMIISIRWLLLECSLPLQVAEVIFAGDEQFSQAHNAQQCRNQFIGRGGEQTYLRYHHNTRLMREDNIVRCGEIGSCNRAALRYHSAFCVFYRYLKVVISAGFEASRQYYICLAYGIVFRAWQRFNVNCRCARATWNHKEHKHRKKDIQILVFDLLFATMDHSFEWNFI